FYARSLDFAALHPFPARRSSDLLRDRFECQYCGDNYPSEELTFDHVLPRSRGGRTTWENVVTACQSCNLVKGSRLPRECGMSPLDRKSTRLNSSHVKISYAVLCL